MVITIVGCGHWSRCFTCPYPDCVTESPQPKLTPKGLLRRKKAIEMRKQGKTIREIALVCGVCRRTIRRDLAR